MEVIKSSSLFCGYLQNQNGLDEGLLKILLKHETVVKLHPESHVVDNKKTSFSVFHLLENSHLHGRILNVVGHSNLIAIASTY